MRYFWNSATLPHLAKLYYFSDKNQINFTVVVNKLWCYLQHHVHMCNMTEITIKCTSIKSRFVYIRFSSKQTTLNANCKKILEKTFFQKKTSVNSCRDGSSARSIDIRNYLRHSHFTMKMFMYGLHIPLTGNDVVADVIKLAASRSTRVQCPGPGSFWISNQSQFISSSNEYYRLRVNKIWQSNARISKIQQ